MPYCNRCGKEITADAAFCSGCGAAVEAKYQAGSAFPVPNAGSQQKHEQEFLETTHRLLRWEQKAWSIASKVFTIVGIVFVACFLLLSLIGIGISDEVGGFLAVFFIMYALIFGGMFIAFGIISRKACQKLPQYIDTVYTDFSLTYNRCNSVGMLVFSVFFGVVSPIFFIINFVRMKSNRALIENILTNQKNA